MMHRLLLLSCSVLLSVSAQALEMPAIFSDHMVLQRDTPVPVWGKAEPGQQVQVRFGGQQVQAVADEAGDWRVDLSDMAASAEPRALEVVELGAEGESKAFRDVLVGEVWQCSGQSNMEWPVQASDRPDEEIASADYPQIRLFTQPKMSVPDEQFTAGGTWSVCSPETVAQFSAVGYFFGRTLYERLDVPIGLIDTAWGGAAAEAYTSRASLDASEVTRPFAKAFDQEIERLRAKREANNEVDPATLPVRHPEPANTGLAEGWAEPGYDDSQWLEIDPINYWENTALGNIDGVVWMRKRVDLPKGWRGKPLTLGLGAIDDADMTYVNGQMVGQTPVSVEASYRVLRVYEVPAALTEEGTLVIAVRVFDNFGGGGFTGPADRLYVREAADPSKSLLITGPWRVKVSHELDPNTLRDAATGKGRSPQHKPGYLWNGMIQPIAPFAMRGVIWYQGETNAGRSAQYDALMRMLIDDWRGLWDQPDTARDFPFLMVQLANFQQPNETPTDDGWAQLRNAQLQTALHHPQTYLATAIDVGQADDIHPTNKQEVGRRLALIALRRVYGQTGFMDQGPLFNGAVVEPGEGPARMRLDFRFAQGLTTRDGQPPRGFAVRQGHAGVWRWAADAAIDGETVLVTAPEGVEAPFAVRYGWSINPTDGPHGINLVNGEGLPAFPFESLPAGN